MANLGSIILKDSYRKEEHIAQGTLCLLNSLRGWLLVIEVSI